MSERINPEMTLEDAEPTGPTITSSTAKCPIHNPDGTSHDPTNKVIMGLFRAMEGFDWEYIGVHPTEVEINVNIVPKLKSFTVSVNNKHINKWYDSGQNKQEHPLKLAIEEQHDVTNVEIGGSTMVVIDGKIYDCVANMNKMDKLLRAIEAGWMITPAMVPAVLTFRMAQVSKDSLVASKGGSIPPLSYCCVSILINQFINQLTIK